MIKLIIGLICECGKTSEFTTILKDGGEAPLRCSHCKRYFTVKSVTGDVKELIVDPFNLRKKSDPPTH